MSDWKLTRARDFSGVKGPVVVCIMDGVGIAPPGPGNAVALARTPHLDALQQSPLATSLKAHGTAVGMPSDDDMGNSEVGHNAMGAGRVFAQGATLVSQAISSESIFEGSVWKKMIEQAAQESHCLHFLGLLSDGNVHSHIEHLFALLRRAARDVKCVRVHILLDGRDVPDHSALHYVEKLESLLAEINHKSGHDYRIASGGGRMVTTMDRYNADWSVVKRGWEAHVHGQGRAFPSATAAIETYRKEQPNISDQQLPPFVVTEASGKPVGRIQTGDTVVLFNFRGDRALEISRAFTESGFSAFDRGEMPHVMFVGMLQYDGDLHIPKNYLVAPPLIDRTLGEYLARNKISQLAVSETQKFGHVTYFWNGNRSGMFDKQFEHYVEIPSDLKPFEERPWMKAAEITDVTLEELEAGSYRHARLNFPNGDMVGHTGKLEAAIVSIEAIDIQVGRLMSEIQALEGALVVTADHGNAEEMFEMEAGTHTLKRDGNGAAIPKTSHSLNPVPLYVFAPKTKLKIDPQVEQPGLANLTATILYLMGFSAPSGYLPSVLTS